MCMPSVVGTAVPASFAAIELWLARPYESIESNGHQPTQARGRPDGECAHGHRESQCLQGAVAMAHRGPLQRRCHICSRAYLLGNPGYLKWPVYYSAALAACKPGGALHLHRGAH